MIHHSLIAAAEESIKNPIWSPKALPSGKWVYNIAVLDNKVEFHKANKVNYKKGQCNQACLSKVKKKYNNINDNPAITTQRPEIACKADEIKS